MIAAIGEAATANREANDALFDNRTRSLRVEAILLKLAQADIGEANKRSTREALLQVWEAQADCDGACKALDSSHVCLHTIARKLHSLISFERAVLTLSRSAKIRTYEAAEAALLHDQEELQIA